MKTPEEKIAILCSVLLSDCRKPTVMGQIWHARYHHMFFIILSTAGILLAVWTKDEFKLGIIIGLFLAVSAFNIGRAGFKAKAVKTLMKEGVI